MSESDLPHATYWSVDPEKERLTATTPEDAVEEWVEEAWPHRPHPGPVTVYGWAHKVVPDTIRDHLVTLVLEAMDEWLSDDFGDRDTEYFTSAGQERAAADFVAAYLADYVVYQCVREVSLDVPAEEDA